MLESRRIISQGTLTLKQKPAEDGFRNSEMQMSCKRSRSLVEAGRPSNYRSLFELNPDIYSSGPLGHLAMRQIIMGVDANS